MKNETNRRRRISHSDNLFAPTESHTDNGEFELRVALTLTGFIVGFMTAILTLGF